MKTNEADSPWDPKPEDQKVEGSAKRYKEGVDQLERDTLRFLELIPDIEMANVRIATNVAFPLAHESSERALTKGDFEPENAKALLVKLGVPLEYLESQDSFSMPVLKTTYKKMVCRYLGAHSTVSAKIEIETGLEPLELAIKSTDSGLEAQASGSMLCEQEGVKTMKKAVAKDPRMKEVRRAVEIPKFGNKFQEQNPNIPLEDLKCDNKRFLKQVSTKSFPLFGLPVIKAVIGAADNDAAHQGAEAITEVLAKEKYLFYDENGEPLDLRTKVDEHVQGCSDCCEVQEIKSKVSGLGEGHLFPIPESLEDQVLLFADRRHQGFAEAYRRIKSWADFPDLKRKVLNNKLKADKQGFSLHCRFRSRSTQQNARSVGSERPSSYCHLNRGKPSAGVITSSSSSDTMDPER